MSPWQAMRVRVDAQIDQAVALIAELANVGEYELIVWLATAIDFEVAHLPAAPRDPWRRLLELRESFPRNAGVSLAPIVSLHWAKLSGGNAFVERAQGERYRVTFDADKSTRAKRRATIAHELAHIDLGNITQLGRHARSDELYRAANEANEVATDLRSLELFDIDPAELLYVRRAA